MSEPHKTDARLNEARMNVQNPDELPEPPRRRLWFRKKRYLLSILSVVFMIIIGFTFGDTSPPRVSDADDAPTSAAEAAARCQPAEPFVLTAISDGLAELTEVTLSGGQAVRSRDFESLWFIATAVEGPEIPAGTTVVWAVDRNDQRVTTIFAVDKLADEISLWGDVVVAEDPPRMSDDGAREAQACVQRAG